MIVEPSAQLALPPSMAYFFQIRVAIITNGSFNTMDEVFTQRLTSASDTEGKCEGEEVN